MPTPAPNIVAASSDSREWAAKVAMLEHEIEQLQSALEDRGAELQVAKDSEAEYMSRFQSLEISVASQALQLQTMLAQSASEKSLFLEEKEHLQLLFDKQQQLCVSLTSQVVGLTANCERLQSQAHGSSIRHHLEIERYVKETEQKDAAISMEQKRCSDAISRTNELETVISDLQSSLHSMQSANSEQAKQIALISQQLDEALRQVAKYEHDLASNEVCFLSYSILCVCACNPHFRGAYTM